MMKRTRNKIKINNEAVIIRLAFLFVLFLVVLSFHSAFARHLGLLAGEGHLAGAKGLEGAAASGQDHDGEGVECERAG